MIYSPDTGSSKDPFSTKPSVEVIQGDCREAVPKHGKFDLIFADPPFNIGMPYKGYLERMIKAYTNPADRVCDPFAGSGTTTVVAQALDRRCVTIDVSEASCNSVKARLKKGAVRVSPSFHR